MPPRKATPSVDGRSPKSKNPRSGAAERQGRASMSASKKAMDARYGSKKK